MGTPIYNAFKKELGFTDAANEYIEVLLRNMENQNLSEKEFQKLANQLLIKVNDYSIVNASFQIRKGYIISVYKSFDNFLQLTHNHIKKYATRFEARADGESLLKNTYKLIFGMQETDTNNYLLYLICDYYRLIRNAYAHTENTENINRAYNLILKHPINIHSVFPKLDAPHDSSNINFDDFILYSRAAKKLAYELINNISYDTDKIAESFSVTEMKKLKNNTARITTQIFLFLDMNFNISDSQKEDIVNAVIAKI